MGSKKVTIGATLGKKTAGQAKTILKKRYPTLGPEIDEAIEAYYGKDEGAEKLKGNDKARAAKPEPKSSAK